MSASPGGNPLGPDGPDITTLPDFVDKMRGKSVTMGADIKSLGKQLKSATYRDFEFRCDEPEWLGGEDNYPQPLTYLAAAVGF